MHYSYTGSSALDLQNRVVLPLGIGGSGVRRLCGQLRERRARALPARHGDGNAAPHIPASTAPIAVPGIDALEGPPRAFGYKFVALKSADHIWISARDEISRLLDFDNQLPLWRSNWWRR